MWSTLDRYRVDQTTTRAVLLIDTTSGEKTWVPRSLCMGGDLLSPPMTDIIVATWFADKEGLRY